MSVVNCLLSNIQGSAKKMKKMNERRIISSFIVIWVCNSLHLTNSSTDGLFSGCRNLSNAHYNYLKTPGSSVSLDCPKNCSSGETRWYHSYFKTTAAAAKGLDLLAWSGSSHEAAVRETPSQGSVGYFCCACEGEEDAARDGCCWGVAYHPVVKLTISAARQWTEDGETVVVKDTSISLRCEARGFPNISVSVSPLANNPNENHTINHDHHGHSQCREVVKSWYSSVIECNWMADGGNEPETEVVFKCNGTILMDSMDSQTVPHSTTTSHTVSICNIPSLQRLYQASKLEVGSQLDLKCEAECCRRSLCNMSWYFEGEKIDTDSAGYKMSLKEEDDDGLVHTLTVENPGSENLGKYFCVLGSPLRESLDKRTLAVTLPGGVKPTPMKPLPGPVEDVTDARGSGTILAVAAMATGSLIVAVLLLCIIVYRDKEKVIKGHVMGSRRSVDTQILIKNDGANEIESRGIIRHRQSENNLLDIDHE